MRGARPNPQETDDDLLRQQEEFLLTGVKPSAKVHRRQPPSVGGFTRIGTPVKVADNAHVEPISTSVSVSSQEALTGFGETPAEATRGDHEEISKPTATRQSHFARSASKLESSGALAAAHRELLEREKQAKVEEVTGDPNAPAVKRVVDFNSNLGTVMGQVAEKDVVKLDFNLGGISKPHQTGFPEPVHRSEFARRRAKAKMKEATNGQESAQEPATRDVIAPMAFHQPLTSTGDGHVSNADNIYQQIHEENINRLQSMSDAEIEQERASLISSLNPVLVQKLMNRKPLVEREAAPSSSPTSISPSGGDISRNLTSSPTQKASTQASEEDDMPFEMNSDGEIVSIPKMRRRSSGHRFESLSSSPKPNLAQLVEVKGETESADDPIAMYKTYYRDVPIEKEKLEWMGINPPSKKAPTKGVTSSPLSNEVSTTPTASPLPSPIPSPVMFSPDPQHPAFNLRFDFYGALLDPASKSVPVHKGLHHHGANPDLPGYTISELLHLMRSQVPSQRVIALNTMGRIISRMKAATYGVEISRNIYEFLIHQAGAVVYLRSSIDDNHIAVVVASINALAAWMLEDTDCYGGRSYFSTYGGVIAEEDTWGVDEKLQPMTRGGDGIWMRPPHLSRTQVGQQSTSSTLDVKSSRAHVNLEDEDDDDEELTTDGNHAPTAQETVMQQAARAERNLVSAFVRMHLLQRFQYLLETWAPGSDGGLNATACDLIMRMIERCTRSSRSTAEFILKHHQPLIDSVWDWSISETQWPLLDRAEDASTDSDTSQSSGNQTTMKSRRRFQLSKKWPRLLGIRIIRNLAQTSRVFARDVVVGKGYMDHLLRFLLISPNSMVHLEAKTLAFQLQIETLRLYHVLANYGLGCHILNDIFVNIPGWISDAIYDGDGATVDVQELRLRSWHKRRAIVTLTLLESYVHNAADNHRTEPEHGISWAQPTSFLSSVAEGIDVWVRHCGENNGAYFLVDVSLLASAIAYITAWISYWNPSGLDHSAEEAKTIWTSMEKIWTGDLLDVVIGALLMVEEAEKNKKEYDESWELPNLAGIYHPRMIPPIKQAANRTVMVNMIVRVLQAWDAFGRLELEDITPRCRELVQSDVIIALNLAAAEHAQSEVRSAQNHWRLAFVRQEIYLLFAWCQAIVTLSPLSQVSSETPQSIIRINASIVFDLMAILQPGDEYMAVWLLQHCVLSPCMPRSFTRDTSASLSDILRPFYRSTVGYPSRLSASEASCRRLNNKITEQMFDCGANRGKFPSSRLPLGPNWIYCPIDELYHATSSRALRELPSDYTSTGTDVIVATLRMIEASIGFRGIPAEETNLLLIALMKIHLVQPNVLTLAGEDESEEEIFQFKPVASLIEHCLDQFSISRWIPPKASTPALEALDKAFYDSSFYIQKSGKPFYQFYQDFAAAFASSSFGDRSFARLLIPPLCSKSPRDYKDLIWNDMNDILRLIQVHIEELPTIGPHGYDDYVSPPEQNTTILSYYLTALVEKRVQRPSVLYWVAIHHLAHATFSKTVNAEFGKIIITRLVSKADEGLLEDWLFYNTTTSFRGLTPPLTQHFVILDPTRRKERVARIQDASSPDVQKQVVARFPMYVE